nr:MAG TPA: hypothetical protein [Caudoviricetes sp.]
MLSLFNNTTHPGKLLTSITLFLLNFINTTHAKKHRRLSSPMPLAPLSTI